MIATAPQIFHPPDIFIHPHPGPNPGNKLHNNPAIRPSYASFFTDFEIDSLFSKMIINVGNPII
jgi:hypothetical protein